jgi:hypothetical protein
VKVNGTLPVVVSNTTSAPAIGSDMNDPGRIAYQSFVSCSNQSAGICSSSGWYPVFPAVPAGHRLVILDVSAVGTTSPGAGGPGAVIVTLCRSSGSALCSGAAVNFTLPPLATGSSGTYSYFGSQPVHFYLDAGSVPLVNVVPQVGILQTGNTPSVTLTGYLLDCSAAPCSAIAQ